MTNTVDLQRYVNKVVKVRYKNGRMKEGIVTFEPSVRKQESHNYFFLGIGFTREGFTFGVYAEQGYHIVDVEEVDKYERLVAEVLELKREVQSLRAELTASESVEVATPKVTLKPMRATRSIVVQPGEYTEYCDTHGEEPTKAGFTDYLTQEMDFLFREEGCYEETVEEIEQ